MSDRTSIQEATKVAKEMWGKHGIPNPLKFGAFCMSLLPIPVIGQVGQAIDRHYSDVETKRQMESLWESISVLNEKLNQNIPLEESIQIIANVLNEHPAERDKANALLNKFGSDISEFKSISENGSLIHLSKSIIEADLSLFSATDGSRTNIQASEVKSHRTTVRATNNSQVWVDSTTFGTQSGSIGMQGIGITGNISMEGSSIGFGPGGSISFGGNPNIVTGECSACKNQFQLDKRALVGYAYVQCPRCKMNLKIQ